MYLQSRSFIHIPHNINHSISHRSEIFSLISTIRFTFISDKREGPSTAEERSASTLKKPQYVGRHSSRVVKRTMPPLSGRTASEFDSMKAYFFSCETRFGCTTYLLYKHHIISGVCRTHNAAVAVARDCAWPETY